MRRTISRLAGEVFDLLIIGGGATGACVARDASRRGLAVALVDKGDFLGATSAYNTKLIHGGLRYLRTYDFSLVREALRERRIWQFIAPHLVHPLPFLVPMVGAGLAGRLFIGAGLTLYDLLSYDRARLADPYQRLPGASWLGRRATVEREPLLDLPGLEGAFVYYDAQMYSPERLGLECLIDAEAHGAVVANYVEAEKLLLRGGSVEGCTVHDVIGASQFDIRARQTLLAAGPWTDIVFQRALGSTALPKLNRSKGIHVIVPARTGASALTVAAGDGHFFVIPWRGHTLLGTTDTPFDGDPGEATVSENDIDTFLGLINHHLPSGALRRDEVEYAYAGVRPLIDDGSGETYGASRRAEIVDHQNLGGIGGVISVLGGKWTGSRYLAQITTDLVAKKSGRRTTACTTATQRLPGGSIDRFPTFEADAAARYGSAASPHLVRLYGSRIGAVLDGAAGRPDLLAAVGNTGDIVAQILHAVREEMAVRLEDVVLRRTGIGQLGLPSAEILDTVSSLMATALGWNETHRAQEVAALADRYRIAG